MEQFTKIKSPGLLALLLVGLFSACQQQINVEPGVTEINSLKDVKVSDQFNFQTSENLDVRIDVKSYQDESLAGVPLSIFDNDPENGGNLLFKGITNANGELDIQLAVPAYLENLYLVADYIGIPREHALSIQDNQITYAIGGSAFIQNKVKGYPLQAPKGKNSSKYRYPGNYDSNGVPDYLESTNDVINGAFLDDVNATLPESYPVPDNNPQYLAEGNDTDIQLDEEADVWVTFVHEGAGWRNTLGYYTYDLNNPPQSKDDIEDLNIIFPNVSLSGSGGGLIAGNKVKLGRFSAGTGIGWFIVAQGWNGSAAGNGVYLHYSNPDFNIEANAEDRQHCVLIRDDQRQLILMGFEDIRRDSPSCDQDFNDAIFYVTANPFTAITTENMPPVTRTGDDADEDGVTDPNDEYPNDPNRAFNSYYPGENQYGTLAYEDLWPGQGDYDFNDLVVNYNHQFVLNANNEVVDVIIRNVQRASGASFENGFAYMLDVPASQVSSVTGSQLSEGYMSIAANGVEANQTQAVIPIFDNSQTLQDRPAGFFINTELDAPKVANSDTITVRVELNSPASSSEIWPSILNPFLISNKRRGYEVHLKGFAPTDLADVSLFGTSSDRTDPNLGLYYMTENGLPFALALPESFDYPIEKTDITQAYINFASWASSEGTLFTNWYQDVNGQRASSSIYR